MYSVAACSDAKYIKLMRKSIKDLSYNVMAAGVTGLKKLVPNEVDKSLNTLDEDTKNHIMPLLKKFNSQN